MTYVMAGCWMRIEKLDQEKLVNGAINGMIEALDDPYSDYMTDKEAEGFHQSISSSFEGIGAEPRLSHTGSHLLSSSLGRQSKDSDQPVPAG